MISKQYTDRIFGLDFIRALAIALILSAQCIWMLPQTNGLISQLSSLFSFIGLEIFFVLSGFLLGTAILPHFINNDFGLTSVRLFLKRRAIRILPLYYLILIINFFIVLSLGNSTESSWKYFFFLQNLTTPISSFFAESWGLPIIIFPAILFPLALFILNQLFKTKNKSILFLLTNTALILVFIIIKYIYNSNTTNTTINQWDTFLKSVTIYRLDSVFIGVMFSWFQYNYPLFWKKYKMLSVLFAIIGLAFIFVGVGHFHLLIDNHKLFWNVFYLPFTSLSIALLLPFLSQWKSAFSFATRPITFISNISYAIYLVHFGIVLQQMKYFYPVASLNSKNLFALVFIYISMTILLSAILYQFYERPIFKKANKSK